MKTILLRFLSILALASPASAQGITIGKKGVNPFSSGEPQPTFIQKPLPTSLFTSRGGVDIDAIVLHTTEGPTAQGAWYTLLSKGYSTHFIVEKNGAIWQTGPLDLAGKHAPTYNSRSIGIDLVGYACSPLLLTDAMSESLVKLVRWLCEKFQIPRVHPAPPLELNLLPLEMKDTPCTSGTKKVPTNAYAPAPVWKKIAPGYKETNPGIIGHYQSSPETRYDPGPFFPWSAFIQAINVPLAPQAIGLGTLKGVKDYPIIKVPAATLQWKEPTTTEVGGYSVEMEYIDPISLEWTLWNSSVVVAAQKSPQQTIVSLGPLGKYRWRVKALNLYGQSPPSAWLYFYYAVALPSAPTIVIPNQSNATLKQPVTIAWLPQAAEGVYGYAITVTVYQQEAWVELFSDSIEGAAGFYTLPKLTPGLWYTFKVMAGNGLGWGDWSSVQFKAQ